MINAPPPGFDAAVFMGPFHWHQSWELLPGVVTPGPSPVRDLLRNAGVPDDLTGRSVLDIGASNGCMALECERRGAARVVALSLEDPAGTGFDAMAALLGAERTTYVRGTIYDLDPGRIGRFDIVLCFGVIYHLRYPVLGLDNLRRVASDTLYLESQVLDRCLIVDGIEEPLGRLSDACLLQFYPGSELGHDPSVWFSPSQAAVSALLRTAGFEVRSSLLHAQRGYWVASAVPGVPPFAGETDGPTYEGMFYDQSLLRLLGPRTQLATPSVERAPAEELPSFGQLRQDDWVMQMTAGRRGGTFIDIGATNGVDINNTYVLETRLGWSGVCVEPNPGYFRELVRNRSAMCLPRAVWPEDGTTLPFLPCDEYGTLAGFEASDGHAGLRRSLMADRERITVETISPAELLRVSGLPPLIDYLSIDTEGTEWEILGSFDFTTQRPALITIEHNFDELRRGIVAEYLGGQGYRRVPVQWDDWFYCVAALDTLNEGAVLDYAAISARFADPAPQPEPARPLVGRAMETTVPAAIETEARIAMAARCRDSDSVPKVPGAGDVLDEGRVQRMHNGILVPADAYYGAWMTRLITACHGHHEPQEERVFHEVVSRLGPTATMMELGGYWAYYSAWFLKEAPLRRAVIVEPDPVNRAVGERTLALNGLEATVLAGFIGRTAAPAVPFRTENAGLLRLPRRTVPDLMQAQGLDTLDLLHCDIQGAELDMLEGCRDLLQAGRIAWLFVSTHDRGATGDPLTHQRCLALLQELGATIEAEHDVHESFSADGLIVARFVPAPPGWMPVTLSYNRYSTSMFRNPVYDLAAALTAMRGGEGR